MGFDADLRRCWPGPTRLEIKPDPDSREYAQNKTYKGSQRGDGRAPRVSLGSAGAAAVAS